LDQLCKPKNIRDCIIMVAYYDHTNVLYKLQQLGINLDYKLIVRASALNSNDPYRVLITAALRSKNITFTQLPIETTQDELHEIVDVVNRINGHED